jgi:excinuclease ABC subunit C
MISSVLDDIPGLGPSKRQALMKYFGSVKKIRAASLDELKQVPGFGDKLAATYHSKVAGKCKPGCWAWLVAFVLSL